MSLARAAGFHGSRHAQLDTEHQELNLSILWRVFRFMSPYADTRNWVFVLSALRAVQRPAMGVAIGAIINGPIARGDVTGTMWGALGFLCLALLNEIVFHLRMRLALGLGERVAQDMRKGIFNKLQEMTLSYYHQTKLGSLLSRYISDIENVRRGVQTVFFFALMMLGQMIISGLCMLFYNPLLFGLLLVIAPIVYLINSYFRKRLGHWSRQAQVSQSRLTSKIAEAINGMSLIQVFTRERRTADEFELLADQHAGNNQNLARNTAVYLPLLELSSQFFLAMLLVVGGYAALGNHFNTEIGDFIAFFFLANFFFTPVQNIGRIYTQALSSMAGAERVFSLLDREPEWKEGPPLKPWTQCQGHIEIRNLRFRYGGSNRDALRQIDLEAKPGQSLALVGHTGSGKSTLANLVCKFYLPTEGEILIDGLSTRELDGRSLRARCGIVTQTPFLFDGTILENLRLGKEDADEEEAMEAFQSLDCDGLLRYLPHGLDTQVGENGRNLSLGQRQLVCFARAALRDPALLVLDEATSAVDAVTEMRLQTAMKKLMKGRTCLFIAHRLSAITSVDLIVTLRHGRVVERGTHEELMQLDGYYAALFREFRGARAAS